MSDSRYVLKILAASLFLGCFSQQEDITAVDGALLTSKVVPFHKDSIAQVDFEVVSKLGQGNFGKVVLVRKSWLFIRTNEYDAADSMPRRFVLQISTRYLVLAGQSKLII